jgi:outer membrane protein
LVDPADPVEEADQRFEDEGKLLKTGLIHRSDLQAIDHAADAAHYDVKSQWGNYLPKLDLQANMVSGGHYLYNQTVAGQDVVPASQTGLYSQLGSQIDYSVGLVLTWTIFDRFSNQQDVAKARVQASNAQIDAQDIRNQVQADVRLAYNNYKTATQRLRSSRKGLEAARKAYEVIEGRYEVGSATFIDLITAQSTLLQAESTRAQALSDFTLQAKVLEFATGETQVEN